MTEPPVPAGHRGPTVPSHETAPALLRAGIEVSVDRVPDDVTPTTTRGDDASLPPQSPDDAFQTYVVGEIDILYRVAVTLTRNPTDAEDLVQDTLLRAYRAIDRFDGAHPRAWLLTILRHTHYNRIRKRQPVLLADGESAQRVLEHTGPSAPSSEDVALAEQFEPVIARALADLPDDFRAVIDLVDLQGLSYAQAADRLAIPKGTVMSRLHRARRRLRATLDEAGLVPHPRRPR
jgi:RNA polymerase sigma-70 factor, ECF subfamily